MKTRISILIKDNKKEGTIDFIYSKKDIEKPKDKDEEVFLISVSQLIRGVLDNGFGFVDKKDVKHGEDVSK